MKKYVVMLLVLISANSLALGQTAIAKLKYEDAEEAYAANNFELTLKKLQEAEDILKASNPKLLYLKILATDKLIHQPAFMNDPPLVYQLRMDCDLYLKKYENLPDNDDKYRAVYKVAEAAKEYPFDEATYLGALKGNTDAQMKMAAIYYRRHGTNNYLDRAIPWFEKAALKGNTKAMWELGFIYQFNYKDLTNSVKWHEMAAAKGSIESIVRLAETYKFGFELTQPNFEKAEFWYNKAIAAGSISGYEGLGGIYFQGKLVPKDTKKALDLYITATGLKPIIDDDHRTLLDCYKSIQEIYITGDGAEKNYAKAEEWIKKSMEIYNKDYPLSASLTALGDIYAEGGFGLTQNYAAAYENYTLAIKAYDNYAQPKIGLAKLYKNGNGVKKNKQQALQLMDKVIFIYTGYVNQGSTSYANDLAKIYSEGIVVEPDAFKAAEWRAKAKGGK